MLTLEFELLNVRKEKQSVKITPDAPVQKEDKYGKSLCDTDAL